MDNNSWGPCCWSPWPEGNDFVVLKKRTLGTSAEGKKNDNGKLRYDLIPVYPLEELARVYTIGSRKYNDHNWRGGFRWGRIFAALCRHAFAWWRGETYDPKDGQHHLASVAWCAFALMEFEKYTIGEDDRIIHATAGGSSNAGFSMVEQPTVKVHNDL